MMNSHKFLLALAISLASVSAWAQGQVSGLVRDAEGNPLTDQKRWERDIEVKYVVQSGSLKDMSLRLRQATTRATAFESDLDEVRVIVEYPLAIL